MKLKAVIFNFLILALGVDTLALSYSHAVQTPEGCARKLVDGTDGLKAYLSMLLENGLIRDEAFKLFKQNLQNGKLINPITEEMAGLDAILYLHREGLDKNYFLNPKVSLDLKELQNWVKETIRKKEQAKQEQNRTEKKTEDPFRKMTLHRIPKGEFMMGESKDISIEITRDFLMTDTHITQAQWVEVMGENPSKFKDREYSVTVEIDGKTVRLQPNHPIENVTWWSVLEFANRLSVKHGLKPVYDLSKVIPYFQNGTKAEGGSWTVEDGKKKEASELLKILSQSHGFTDTEGYRLATEVEYEYVLQNLGKSQAPYIFGDSEKELKEYAWFGENSEEKTHEVGAKKAFLIDQNPFYDLHGNVWSWVWDWRQVNLENGKDPVGPPSGSSRVVRGGCWGSSAQHLRSTFRNYYSPSDHWYSVGFRLVRTLP